MVYYVAMDIQSNIYLRFQLTSRVQPDSYQAAPHQGM